MALVSIGAFSFMILFTRKKRRIRGFFLFVPIIGIISSIGNIPTTLIIVFSNYSAAEIMENDYFSYVGDLLLLICMVLFILKQRKWRDKSSGIGINESEFELSIWERRLLNSNGLLMLIITTFVISIPDVKGLASYEKYFIAGFTVVNLMIVSSVFMMVVKSNSSNYYKALAEVNEHYLTAQLNHFKAYQETQRETKRIRHDMKNHMLCINDLYDRGEYGKLGEYLHELNDSVLGIDRELHIGNDVADAIINEKNAIARAEGFEIHTEGSLAGITEITPMDICTIFANAIDNCLEALKKLEIPKPVIEISVRRDNKFLLITFINAIGEEAALIYDKQLTTTKKDMENHGFGLENIRATAEKYKGSSKYSIAEREDGGKAFCLEVMMML